MDFNPLNLFTQDSDSELFSSGETVFVEGDQADHMYVVRSGEIRLSINGVEINRLGAGDIFGEMALISPSPRSTTAVAAADSELVAVDRKRFTFMIQNTPFFALHVMRVLADRLRQTSEQLA